MNNHVKKQILSLIIVILTTSFIISVDSCKRNQKTEEEVINKEQIVKKAIELSEQHNTLVKKALEKMEYIPAKEDDDLSLEDVFNIIETATGVSPIIVSSTDSVINNANYYVDYGEGFHFSDYSISPLVDDYFATIDFLIDGMSDIHEVYDLFDLLEDIEYDVLNDPNATEPEINLIVSAVEVFEGSLRLWYDYFDFYSKSSPEDWPKWKKWLFVGAADALGAVLGTLTGSTVIVMGYPIYIPAGPWGGAASSAVFSLVAAIYVRVNI